MRAARGTGAAGAKALRDGGPADDARAADDAEAAKDAEVADDAGTAHNAGAVGTVRGAADSACPTCGETVSPADGFCEACGRELSTVAVSVGSPGHAARCPGCGSPQISADGYCEQCGHKVPAGRDHVEIDLGVIAGVTDRGVRHHRNEDAMAMASHLTAAGPAAVAVVCDGVSTSQRPDDASLAAAEAAVRVLLTAVRSGADAAVASERAVGAATDAIAGLTTGSANAPAATYVSAVITNRVVTVSWVGDSRAYWLPASSGATARLLTRDDSWSAEMVAGGVLSEAEAAASPQAHVVTRWLGVDAGSAPPHVTTFEPDEPGVLLLCSDGLWNYSPAPAHLAGLALPSALTDPLAAAARLVAFAIEAGGQDNITVVLAPLPLGDRAGASGPDVAGHDVHPTSGDGAAGPPISTADEHRPEEGAG